MKFDNFDPFDKLITRAWSSCAVAGKEGTAADIWEKLAEWGVEIKKAGNASREVGEKVINGRLLVLRAQRRLPGG